MTRNRRSWITDSAQHTSENLAVLGVLAVFVLMAIGVARHPESVYGAGGGLLWQDVALLLAYSLVAVWMRYQDGAEVRTAVRIGTIVGLLLGVVYVANHVVELFVPGRNFALVIGPVFLTLALLGGAGSAAWGCSRSLVVALLAGVWCAIVTTIILLLAAFVLNLIFETRAELPLREAFATSGMKDADAFLVRNNLEAASEVLIRMPVVALFLSIIGAFVNMWIIERSRGTAVAGACTALLMFGIGAYALWHANSLERVARPPFILMGIVLVGVALSAVHPIWSALKRSANYT